MSSKTPKESAKKIKSAPNTRYYLVAISAIALVIAGALFFSLSKSNNTPKSVQANGCNGLSVSNECYSLEYASSNKQHIKGLSDRDSLAEKSGMMFVFPEPKEECFWMKDMRFSIDMVWLNEKREIIKIEPNVAPETYPTTYCADNTKYVLEINSGHAQKLGLQQGQMLNF